MPRWTRSDLPKWPGMEMPEQDYDARMGALNRAAATKLVERLEGSNDWRQMSEAGLAYVREHLPLQNELRPYSGLMLSKRIDVDDGVSVLAWFPIAGFEADRDPDAAEIDHAVLLAIWRGAVCTRWGREEAILDLLTTPVKPGRSFDKKRYRPKSKKFDPDIYGLPKSFRE